MSIYSARRSMKRHADNIAQVSAELRDLEQEIADGEYGDPENLPTRTKRKLTTLRNRLARLQAGGGYATPEQRGAWNRFKYAG